MGDALIPVGLAGCGRMGGPMLKALLANGIDARGFDVRLASSFGDLSPNVSNSPKTFSRPLRTLLTVVRDIPQTEELLFDDQAVLSQAPDLRTLIVCSTLSPRYIADLARRLPDHLTLVDAPMSGAQIAAESADLSFMLGGAPDIIEDLMPLFYAMGSSFHHMGPTGAGMQAKVLNNLLAAASTAMTRQTLDWARASGLDRDKFLRLVNASSGQNWLTKGWNEIEFAKDGYDDQNSIGLLVKDIDSALDALPQDADTELADSVRQVILGLAPYRDLDAG